MGRVASVRSFISLSDGTWLPDVENEVEHQTTPKPQALPRLPEKSPLKERPPKDDQPESRTIHILGVGTQAQFVAHSIVGDRKAPPPIRILVHRPGIVKDFKRGGHVIRVMKGEAVTLRRGFRLEALTVDTAGQGNYISQLISAKSRPIQALSWIKHRLDKRSTILLLRQGPEILQELNEKVFPDPETRPTYMLGCVSHGLYPRDPGFGLELHRAGTTYLCTAHHDYTVAKAGRQTYFSGLPTSTRYLLGILTSSPELHSAYFPYLRWQILHFERLAVDAVIGPLTAIFDCLNGELLYNSHVTRITRLLLSEISLIIRSLPELQGFPSLETRFDPDRLEKLVIAILTKTTDSNSVTTRRAVQMDRDTRMLNLNGYLVKRGEELGISCVSNYMVMRMVLAKALIGRYRSEKDVSWV